MVDSGIAWNDLFVYDPESPTGLRNKINRYAGRGKKAIVAKAGDIAGYLTTHGYAHVSYDYAEYGSHRVIWEMFNGKIEEGLWVDHIDGDSRNNRIENLRLVEKRGNSRNRQPRSGRIQGIRLHQYPRGASAWTCYWSEKDTGQKTKYFSIDKLGFRVAFEEAVKCRIEKLEYLKALGDDYTDRHIKSSGYPHNLLDKCSEEEKEIAIGILNYYNLIIWSD